MSSDGRHFGIEGRSFGVGSLSVVVRLAFLLAVFCRCEALLPGLAFSSFGVSALRQSNPSRIRLSSTCCLVRKPFVNSCPPQSSTLSFRAAGESSTPMLGAVGGLSQPKSYDWRSQWQLLLYIFLWYATSVVCTNSSKQLGLHWSVLTWAQLSISSLCGFILIYCLKMVPYQPINNSAQLKSTALLAAAFTMGFITLNSALGMMHVSLVMTLRATEPLFTLFLAAFLLKSEQVTWRMGAALIPIIAGAALSSVESTDFNTIGLAITVLSNIMFALRGVLTKRLKASFPVDNFNLFLQICWLGAIMQGVLLVAMSPFSVVDVKGSLMAAASGPHGGMLLLNGVTFYAYLQLSWVVLSRVAAVTHSVCNSLRRPVMCLFGWLQFGNEITPANAAGIGIASLGTLLYAQVRIWEGKSAE